MTVGVFKIAVADGDMGKDVGLVSGLLVVGDINCDAGVFLAGVMGHGREASEASF